TSYQVTVKLDGKSRTYRALAMFHQPLLSGDQRAPEFWDGVVNGLNRVWEEKRPAYKTKSQLETSYVDSSLSDGTVSDDTSDTFSEDTSDVVFARATRLDHWFTKDIAEHASGEHAGTADYEGVCSV